MVKLTKGMRTTTQMVMDLTALNVILYLIPGQVVYKGYKNTLPKGHKAKITFDLFEYTDLDDDGTFDIVTKKK